MPTYRVRPGDRLSTIAALHGVSAYEVVQANPHKPLQKLSSGAVVFASLAAGEDIALPGTVGRPIVAHPSGMTRGPHGPLPRPAPSAVAGGGGYQTSPFVNEPCQPHFVRDSFGACVLEPGAAQDQQDQGQQDQWQQGQRDQAPSSDPNDPNYDPNYDPQQTDAQRRDAILAAEAPISQVPLPPSDLNQLPPCQLPGYARDAFGACRNQKDGRPFYTAVNMLGSDPGGTVVDGRLFWSDDRVQAVLGQLGQRYVESYGPSGNVMGSAPIHQANGITAIGDAITSMPGVMPAADWVNARLAEGRVILSDVRTYSPPVTADDWIGFTFAAYDLTDPTEQAAFEDVLAGKNSAWYGMGILTGPSNVIAQLQGSQPAAPPAGDPAAPPATPAGDPAPASDPAPATTPSGDPAPPLATCSAPRAACATSGGTWTPDDATDCTGSCGACPAGFYSTGPICSEKSAPGPCANLKDCDDCKDASGQSGKCRAGSCLQGVDCNLPGPSVWPWVAGAVGLLALIGGGVYVATKKPSMMSKSKPSTKLARAGNPAGGGKVGSQKVIANLGDKDFATHGGTVVLEGEHGYSAEHWDPESKQAWRFDIPRLKKVKGHLVPEGYDASWPHPVHQYDEWFVKHLGSIASTVGIKKTELEAMLTSHSAVRRATAYEAIGQVEGFDNLDSYPQSLTDSKAEARYRHV